ncbi:hypothetical protein OHC33_010845 [Knufia fluminis]|uniref:Uncharacterized protein n=1 Tax=Knufia fluminis TaxID=191047 RepID=A0AAN8IHJ8_9EURO|nr:hypothetical protein OHC33_010845 [Knufia fluminis]
MTPTNKVLQPKMKHMFSCLLCPDGKKFDRGPKAGEVSWYRCLEYHIEIEHPEWVGDWTWLQGERVWIERSAPRHSSNGQVKNERSTNAKLNARKSSRKAIVQEDTNANKITRHEERRIDNTTAGYIPIPPPPRVDITEQHVFVYLDEVDKGALAGAMGQDLRKLARMLFSSDRPKGLGWTHHNPDGDDSRNVIRYLLAKIEALKTKDQICGGKEVAEEAATASIADHHARAPSSTTTTEGWSLLPPSSAVTQEGWSLLPPSSNTDITKKRVYIPFGQDDEAAMQGMLGEDMRTLAAMAFPWVLWPLVRPDLPLWTHENPDGVASRHVIRYLLAKIELLRKEEILREEKINSQDSETEDVVVQTRKAQPKKRSLDEFIEAAKKQDAELLESGFEPAEVEEEEQQPPRKKLRLRLRVRGIAPS